MQGLGLGVLENCYPYYPSVEHRGVAVRLVPRARAWRTCRRSTRSSSRTPPPTARTAPRESARWRTTPQPPAIATAVFDAVGVWVTELPITPERVLRALQAKAAGTRRADARRQDGRLRRRALGQRRRQRDHVRGRRLMAELALRHVQRRGALRHLSRRSGSTPIAGDQVFLGRVTYEPGTTVKRHSHEHTEQAMLILEGSVTMTIGDETKELGRATPASSTAASSTSSTPRAASRSSRRSRPCRSTTSAIASAISSSATSTGRCTSSADGDGPGQSRSRHRGEPRHRRRDRGAPAPRRLAGRDGRARERRRPRRARRRRRGRRAGSTASTPRLQRRHGRAQGLSRDDARGLRPGRSTSTSPRSSSWRRRRRGGWSTRAAARSSCSRR